MKRASNAKFRFNLELEKPDASRVMPVSWHLVLRIQRHPFFQWWKWYRSLLQAYATTGLNLLTRQSYEHRGMSCIFPQQQRITAVMAVVIRIMKTVANLKINFFVYYLRIIEGLPGGVLVPLFPSIFALCSHVPAAFPYLFPNISAYHIPPTHCIRSHCVQLSQIQEIHHIDSSIISMGCSVQFLIHKC